MPDKKISQLTSAGALTGTEPLPIVQAGSTVKTTVQDIANLSPTTPTSSLLVTASVVNNTITFTKGNGDQFNLTVNTGSGGGGTANPGGSDMMIQYNSGSSFGATGSFKFIYTSQSLQQGNNTTALGQYSHAEGWLTQTVGNASHAEGQNTITSGSYSHAEGAYSQAIGDWSHAEGANTRAIGDYSHAEGNQSNAIGFASHAAGLSTSASAAYQLTIGQYNITSSVQSAFIIGNGTSNSSRSNLVFASGQQVQVTGSLNITGSLSLNGSPVGGVDTSAFVTTGSMTTTQRVSGSVLITGSLEMDTYSLLTIPAQSGSFPTVYPSNPKPGTMLFYTSASVNELQIYNGNTWVSVGLVI